jgi:hypothetical protein
MAGRSGKRPRVASINPSAVDDAASILDDLPEKEKESFSLREAVTELQEQIKSALAKGYSYEDVAELLAKKGIDISASTLKNYVPAGKRQTRATSRTTARATAAQPATRATTTRAATPRATTTEPTTTRTTSAKSVAKAGLTATRGRKAAVKPEPVEAPVAEVAPKRRGRKPASAAAPEPVVQVTVKAAAKPGRPAKSAKTARASAAAAKAAPTAARRGRRRTSL